MAEQNREIRLLGPADAGAYAALRREMLEDSPWAFAASPGSDRGCDAQGVGRSLAGAGYAIAGAWEGGILRAAAGVHREASPKRWHVAWLWGVYVSPGFRGRGLGRGVVSAAVAEARTWPGLGGLLLSVSERSPEARGLYVSMGFEPFGVEKDAIRVDGISYAETHMRLAVQA